MQRPSGVVDVPLVFLGEGMPMIKYSRSGKASSFFLRYRPDSQYFEWDSSSKRVDDTRVMLGDIAAITTGAQAHTRPSSKRDIIDLHKKARCFTIKYFKSDPVFYHQLTQARQAYVDAASLSFYEQQQRKMTLDHLELQRKHKRDSASLLELDLEPMSDSAFNLCVNTIRNLLREYETKAAACRSQETEAEIAFRQPDEPIVLRHPSAPPIVMDQQQMNPIPRVASLSSNSSSVSSAGAGSNLNSPSSANSGRGLEGQMNQSAPPPIPNSRRPQLVDRPRSNSQVQAHAAGEAWPELLGHQQASPPQPALVSPASIFSEPVAPRAGAVASPPMPAITVADMDRLLRLACDPSLGYIPNWSINRTIYDILCRNPSKADAFLVETIFFNLLTSSNHYIALQALLLFEYLAENVPNFKDAKSFSYHQFVEANFVKQLPKWSRKPIKFAQETFGYKSWFNVLGNEAQRGKVWNEQHEPIAMLRWNKIKEIITKQSRDNSHPSSTVWRVAAFKLHLGGAFDDVSPLQLPDGRVMRNPLEGMWASAIGSSTTGEAQKQQFQLQQPQQQPMQQNNGHWPYAQPQRPQGNMDLAAGDLEGEAAIAQQAALLRHFQEKREYEEMRALEQAQRNSHQNRERAHSLPQAQQPPNMYPQLQQQQQQQMFNPAPLPVVPSVVPPVMPLPVPTPQMSNPPMPTPPMPNMPADQLPPRALASYPADPPAPQQQPLLVANNQPIGVVPFDQVHHIPFATPIDPPSATPAPVSLQSRRYFNSQSQLAGGNLLPPQLYKGPGILDGDRAHFQCIMNLVSDDIQLLNGLLRSSAHSDWSESKMVALCHDISGIQTDLQNAVNRCTALNGAPVWFNDAQLDLLLNIIEQIHDILKMYHNVNHSRRAASVANQQPLQNIPPRPQQQPQQQRQQYQPQYPNIASASSVPVPVQRQRSYPESKDDFEEEEKGHHHHHVVVNSRPPIPERPVVSPQASPGAYVPQTANAAGANAIRPPAFAPQVVPNYLPVAASAPFEHSSSSAASVPVAAAAAVAPTSTPVTAAVPQTAVVAPVVTAPKIQSKEGVASPVSVTRQIATSSTIPVQSVSPPQMPARPLNPERITRARATAPQPPTTSSSASTPVVAVHRIDLSTPTSPGRPVAPTASARAAAAAAAAANVSAAQQKRAMQQQLHAEEEPAETNAEPGFAPARATVTRHAAAEPSRPSHPVLSGLAFPAADILAFNSATVTSSNEGRTKRAVSAKKKSSSSSIPNNDAPKSSLEDSFFQQPLEDLRLDLEGATISAVDAPSSNIMSRTASVAPSGTNLESEADHGAIKLHAKTSRAKKKDKATSKPIVMNY